MAYSYYNYTGDGTTTQFPVAFGYIRREHVLATVAGSPATFTFVNSSTIQMDVVPANGAVVRVYRQTPLTAPLVDFTDGATLVAADLDTNAKQSIYTQQELDDALVDGLAGVIPNGDKGDITTSAGGTVWTVNAGLSATKSSSTQAGAGAVARTVDSKLKDVVSVKDFGAVGDGTTDDSGPVNAMGAALAGGVGTLASLGNRRYLTTGGVDFSNLDNVEFSDSGFIINGTDLYNFPADNYQRVIGQEYLAWFHNLAITNAGFRIKVFGDSRPEGNSQTGNFVWHQALKQAARQRGYYKGVYENNAIGGSTIQDWTNTHIDTYLTGGGSDPNLIVFCAGINDLYVPFGPATPQQVVARLDAFLTKVRVTKGYTLSTLSIAVVVPVSAYNPSQGRDPRFIEPLRNGFRRLARKHQVCLIDGYAVAADGRNQRGLGYAADITAPEVIHQNNVGMIPILAQLIDSVLPNITPMVGGGFYIDSGVYYQPNVADLPATYPTGISFFRAAIASSAWPLDGFVQTLNFIDDIQVQYNFATIASTTDVWLRKGRANAWSSWILVAGSSSAAVTPAAGFSLPGSGGMRAVRDGNIVVSEGYITMNTPAIVSASTVVATFSSAYWPTRDQIYGTATIWNGTTFEQVRCRVNQGVGSLELLQATSINANRIWLNISWSILA
jgi:lysophospholipase L1-like esterase